MAELNKITGVVQGEYGSAITVQIVDSDKQPIDVSTYTTRSCRLRTPDKTKTVSLNLEFTTDGSDGYVKFTPADGDIDRSGSWEGQLVLKKTGVEAHTRTFILEVDKEF